MPCAERGSWVAAFLGGSRAHLNVVVIMFLSFPFLLGRGGSKACTCYVQDCGSLFDACCRLAARLVPLMAPSIDVHFCGS